MKTAIFIERAQHQLITMGQAAQKVQEKKSQEQIKSFFFFSYFSRSLSLALSPPLAFVWWCPSDLIYSETSDPPYDV